MPGGVWKTAARPPLTWHPVAVLLPIACLLMLRSCPCLIPDSWEKRWHKSSWKQNDGSAGGFTLTAGKWFGGDEAAAKGIQTGPDSKYHATWTEMKKAYTNKDKELVLQVG
eukprot:GHUV01046623.1.p2 GENE.GHUV01046623.1~~GHUV01046623.1.p2  ORF type:complete len:111 (-),score=30.71 GHUV01046623.1:103-435(-)